jgi:hypothetical protein
MPILGIMASQISGHLWAPAGAYDALASVTVPSGGAASVTFAGIPTGYKHLQIRGIGKPTSAGGQEVYIRYNGDSAATSYFSHQLYGSGTAAVSASYGTVNQAYITYWSGSEFGSFVCDILDYSNTNKNTTTRALGGHDLNGSGFILLRSGLWINTSAVSSINLFLSSGNFAQYSQLALYGVK